MVTYAVDDAGCIMPSIVGSFFLSFHVFLLRWRQFVCMVLPTKNSVEFCSHGLQWCSVQQHTHTLCICFVIFLLRSYFFLPSLLLLLADFYYDYFSCYVLYLFWKKKNEFVWKISDVSLPDRIRLQNILCVNFKIKQRINVYNFCIHKIA